MEKRILFPTDFSDRANHALSEAIQIAQALSAQLVIYHAYNRPYLEHDKHLDPEKLLRRTEIEIEEKFENLLLEYPTLNEVAHEFRKELGVSVRKIDELTNKEYFDLIIMATKGAKDFGELLGSKTARTIKSVDVPVMVFPDNTTLKGVRKLALACDYSEGSELETMQFLVDFAEKMSLSVDVISMNREERTLTDREKGIREEVKEKLQSIPSSFCYSFNDSVEYGIVDYATHHEVGLIVIVPKSYSFVERLFHESLTTKLAFHSPIPLLVL